MANHIQLDNDVFEALTTYSIPRKELRTIGLLLRLSAGCQKEYAIVKPMRRFEVAGIYQPDIKDTLDKLESKNVIFADFDSGIYMLNYDVADWDYKRPKFDKAKYMKLVGFNLQKYSKTLYLYSKILYEKIVSYYTQKEQDTISEYSKLLYEAAYEASMQAASQPPQDNKERQEEKTIYERPEITKFADSLFSKEWIKDDLERREALTGAWIELGDSKMCEVASRFNEVKEPTYAILQEIIEAVGGIRM